MLRTLLTGLGVTALTAAGLGFAPTAEAHPTYHPYGRVSAHNQVLRQGCTKYSFHYAITVPNNDWSAEFFLINPHHHRLASGVIDAATEPREATRRWSTPICSRSTSTGTYKIKMKVTFNTGLTGSDVRDGYVRPARFRLTPRR